MIAPIPDANFLASIRCYGFAIGGDIASQTYESHNKERSELARDFDLPQVRESQKTCMNSQNA
jgi:hypothetical protein